MPMRKLFESLKDKVIARLKEEDLLKESIFIKARVLSAQEAIGNPQEYDFPLLKGKEKMVEANFRDSVGHAYTDMYGDFQGSLEEVFNIAEAMYDWVEQKDPVPF